MTSLGTNFASNSPFSLAPPGTVNIIPSQPQDDQYISALTYAANPGFVGPGLGSTYQIWQFASDASTPNANIEFALDLVSLFYYVRIARSLKPTVWSAWTQINAAGAAGVTSFNARVGAVVPLAGDYTASQITNVPSGNIPPADTNVQLALNYLQQWSPPPAGIAASGVSTPIPANSGWVSYPTVFSAPGSRGFVPGGWGPGGGGDGITDLNVTATGKNLLHLSVLAGLTSTYTGNFGIRILRNGTIPVIISINPGDGTANENISCAGLFTDIAGDFFQLQVNNLTAAPITIADALLTVVDMGPMP